MLYKLYHHMGITGKTWRIIKNWYTNMKEVICVNGLYSREYNILQGTRQGGIISPWLFLVYINDLYTNENSKWGIFLYNIYYGSPTFADDITVYCAVLKQP